MSSYKCSACNHTSKVKWNLQEHIKKVCKNAVLIEDIVILECEICEKRFSTEKSLKQHKERCFEKKTVVVKEYTGKENIDKTIDNIMITINVMKNHIDRLEIENKELSKRLDKMEKINRDGFEEIPEENEVICEYSKNNGPRIESRTQICEYLSFVEADLRPKNIEVLIDGACKNAKLNYSNISIEGMLYMFDPNDKKKKDRLASDLTIYDVECCSNYSKFHNIKSDSFCCEEHKDYFK